MALEEKDTTASCPVTAPDADLSAEHFAQEAVGCYPALWTLARGLVWSEDDADDLVQEALLTGLKKRGQFTLGTSFLAWMGTIVRFTAMNHRRYAGRRQHLEYEDQHESPASLDATTVVDAATGVMRDGQATFDDDTLYALNALTPVARACLLLRTIHALDYETIGQTLGIPANTALSHVHRARKKMRSLLREQARMTKHDSGPLS